MLMITEEKLHLEMKFTFSAKNQHDSVLLVLQKCEFIKIT